MNTATKPRIRFASDGRRGFPLVVEYETADGTRHVVPPKDGQPYKVIVHDLNEYERMSRTGLLGLGHSYLTFPKVIDNPDAVQRKKGGADHG